MRYVLVLLFLLASPALAEDEAPEFVRGGALHAAFAAGCPTNDDDLSITLAQRMLDAADFHEATAQEIFDSALADAQPESAVGAAMMCELVERMEANHPFK